MTDALGRGIYPRPLWEPILRSPSRLTEARRSARVVSYYYFNERGRGT